MSYMKKFLQKNHSFITNIFSICVYACIFIVLLGFGASINLFNYLFLFAWVILIGIPLYAFWRRSTLTEQELKRSLTYSLFLALFFGLISQIGSFYLTIIFNKETIIRTPIAIFDNISLQIGSIALTISILVSSKIIVDFFYDLRDFFTISLIQISKLKSSERKVICLFALLILFFIVLEILRLWILFTSFK